jgi:Holliday junction resolvase
MDTFEHNMSTGKGGEFAVASELLFRDYNANILTVDSGVDIAAIKDGKTYLFQVKTKHWNKRRQIYVDLEIRKLEQFIAKNQMFFVVVGRHGNDPINDYLIFPIKDLQKYSKKLAIKINKKGNGVVRFVFTRLLNGRITLNGCGDVSLFRGAEGGWGMIR